MTTPPSKASSPFRFGATAYTLLFRGWQAGAGFVSILLIAHYFEPAQQGFYYAFASLIALQSFLDLGLYLVVSVSASHEWARLRLSSSGYIEGETDARSRLVSLGRFLFKWYGTAALVFWVVASLIGLLFFERHNTLGVEWRLQWLLHVAFSALLMWLTPFLSLLEGCNQFASTSRFRLVQSIVSLLSLWFAVIGGAALWSIVLMSGVSLLALLDHLLRKRRAFFSVFYAAPKSAVLSWRHDLLPMQWRLAIQGLFTYLSFPLYTMLIFTHYGPVEGGRMGMTLQIVSALQALATVPIAVSAPGLAVAAAIGAREQLRTDWRRASFRALVLMAVSICVLLLIVALAHKYAWPMAHRVLPVLEFVRLGIAAMLAVLVQSMAIYLRAHKQEKLTSVGVTAGLMYGVVAWSVAKDFGATGIALSHLIITALITFPLTSSIFIVNQRDLSGPSGQRPQCNE